MTKLQRLREAIRVEEPARRRRLVSYYVDELKLARFWRKTVRRELRIAMLCTYFCVFKEPTDDD